MGWRQRTIAQEPFSLRGAPAGYPPSDGRPECGVTLEKPSNRLELGDGKGSIEETLLYDICAAGRNSSKAPPASTEGYVLCIKEILEFSLALTNSMRHLS